MLLPMRPFPNIQKVQKHIQTNTERIIDQVIDIGNRVNIFESDGTSQSNVDSDKIVFNTTVHRIYQPEELISLNKIVGTNAVQLNRSTVIYNGVYVSAHPDNTEPIICGGQSLTRNAVSGYNLAAGESIFLQVANLNRIYVRSVSGNQTVQVIGS